MSLVKNYLLINLSFFTNNNKMLREKARDKLINES